MTTFYGIPGAAPFWHWTTLVHFLLVALAGGFSFYTAVLGTKDAESGRRLAGWALLFIILDLFMLWAESPARFRFTHFWLFLNFRPAAAIWWGAWGLAVSALALLLVVLRLGPARTWFGILLVSSTIVLLYPGYALAANAARPLWDHLLLAFFPVTALLLSLALLVAWRGEEALRWLQAVSWISLLLALLYPVALASGGADQMRALALLLRRGLWFGAGTLLILLAALLARKQPALAAACAFAGALLVRSWIVEEGQHSFFAHGF